MTGSKILQFTPPKGRRDRDAMKAAMSGPGRIVMVISAPGLRAINRIQGFDAGDEFLNRLETVLNDAAPDHATVASLSGAKMAFVHSASNADQALELVGGLYDTIALLSDGEIRVHIGAVWSEVAMDSDDLISAALGALDQARGDGDQGFALVDASAEPNDDMRLAREALLAIRSGDVSVAMQPVVDAQTPGRVLFREALIRLQRQNGEVIAAGRFMPALQRLGVAAEADIAVLEMAAEAMARDPSLRVSVNISVEGLTRPGWRAAFLEIADNHPDVPERLIVEVNEDAASSDLGAATELLMQLRVRGVSLALDDFGAGRTSFQHLRDLRFDILKIDGGFIRGIDSSPDNQMLVSALAGIGRQFDMMVVAEYVETAQEARTLRKLGVEGFQGFLFGKPTLVWSEGEEIGRVQA